MGKLKENVIELIKNNIININLHKSSDKLVDKYLGPFVLMRTYLDSVTIYYQTSYDRVVIPLNWFTLFEGIDVKIGDQISGGTYEPSDKIERFIYLFFKFSRGARFKFSYNTDDAAKLLLDELYKLGTGDFISWLKENCNIELKPWLYKAIDNIIEV